MKSFTRAFFAITALGFSAITQVQAAQTETAIFAGGCFWCVESDFDAVKGVVKTTSGYIGGQGDNPTYKNHSGRKFHEAVEIVYNPAVTNYDTLLDVFWHSVDPTDGGGQFCDRGFSYTTAIYAVDNAQLKQAKASKAAISGKLSASIKTKITSAPEFWPAEGYHQNYYKKNPARYKYYRFACGRDKKIDALWGKNAHRGIAGH